MLCYNNVFSYFTGAVDILVAGGGMLNKWTREILHVGVKWGLATN